MTLYHFCADRCVKGILRNGITTGALTVPMITGWRMRMGFIWLTKDSDARRQSWATQKLIKYSRTDWRLTVEIPDDEIDKIYDRDRLAKEYENAQYCFDGWSGSENWRAFKGSIPKSWITECVRCGDGQNRR